MSIYRENIFDDPDEEAFDTDSEEEELNEKKSPQLFPKIQLPQEGVKNLAQIDELEEDEVYLLLFSKI